MKCLIFLTLIFFCTPPFLSAQHYTVQGNNNLYDLQVSAQYNKPCGLVTYDYSPNANTQLAGLALQHYDPNGSVSSESQYAANDPIFGNIAISRLVNLPNKQYLVASIVESVANTLPGAHILLTIINPVNGDVLRSIAIDVPNAGVNQKAISGVVLNGNTVYVVGTSVTTSTIYSTQIFVVNASIDLTSSVITPNWVRSYYTSSLSFDNRLPSIAYDNETARLWVAQPDNTGKLLLFTLNASNGALLGQRIGAFPGTNVKEVKVAVVRVSKKVYSRCLITRSLNPAGNTHFTVVKLGVNNFGVPSIQTQKSYVLGGNWAMNSVDIQYPTMLVGTTKLLGAASKYNWLKFDMTNCLTQGNMSYTPNRQSGQSVLFGGGVFSVGTIGQPGNTQLVQMRTAATCETPLTIPIVTTNTMIMYAVSISNGLNITSPTMRNMTLIKLNNVSTTQQVCP